MLMKILKVKIRILAVWNDRGLAEPGSHLTSALNRTLFLCYEGSLK